jgi:hypothetical protein
LAALGEFPIAGAQDGCGSVKDDTPGKIDAGLSLGNSFNPEECVYSPLPQVRREAKDGQQKEGCNTRRSDQRSEEKIRQG